MKVKTLSKLLEDYDPSDSVKINKDGELLIGGRGGFLIKLPTSFKRKRKESETRLSDGKEFKFGADLRREFDEIARGN